MDNNFSGLIFIPEFYAIEKVMGKLRSNGGERAIFVFGYNFRPAARAYNNKI
jgi:hypothetical protein